MSLKRAMFVGRWQPPHKGHEWLIRQKLDQGIPVLILVQDILPDKQNPYTTAQTTEMLRTLFQGEPVEIMAIPDIESINWGRGASYERNEYLPPSDLHYISGSAIRELIESGGDPGGYIDSKVVKLIRSYK